MWTYKSNTLFYWVFFLVGPTDSFIVELCGTGFWGQVLRHRARYEMTDVITWGRLRITDALKGEFNGHRWISLTKPVILSFGVSFVANMDKLLNKQSICRWYETT